MALRAINARASDVGRIFAFFSRKANGFSIKIGNDNKSVSNFSCKNMLCGHVVIEFGLQGVSSHCHLEASVEIVFLCVLHSELWFKRS